MKYEQLNDNRKKLIDINYRIIEYADDNKLMTILKSLYLRQ